MTGWEGQEVVLLWQSSFPEAVCLLVLSCDSLWSLFLVLVPSVASMWCTATPVAASGGCGELGQPPISPLSPLEAGCVVGVMFVLRCCFLLSFYPAPVLWVGVVWGQRLKVSA